MKIFLTIFLILHGLIHLLYWVPTNDSKYPFDLTKGWFYKIFGQSGLTTGWIFIILTVFFFIIAGLALAGVPGLTTIVRPLIIIASIISLVLLILFWQPKLIIGILIDLILIYFFWFLNWQIK